MRQETKPNEVKHDYTIALELPRSSDGYLFDVGSLYEQLETLDDQRHAKGKVYPLVAVLVFALLAKLAGQQCLRGIADWVQERGTWLTAALGLPLRRDRAGEVRMPCHTTYSRVLGKAMKVEQLEAHVSAYLTACSQDHAWPADTLQISLDGKKIRGTVSPTRPGGVYLLGAYLPHAGLMLFQVEIGSRQAELTLAPKLLNALDLQGKVVTGDAGFTQRNLSAQIVATGGDYVWKVKENQPTLYQDIADVFQAPRDAPLPGFAAPAAGGDFRTSEQWSAGHGRVERRRLTASRDLLGYSDWPGLDQVFAYECLSTQKASGETTCKLTYGVTSLPPQEACPRCLLHLVRDHWGIESGSHYRRDVTLHEDNAQLEVGHLAQVMACLNNLVIALTVGRRQANLPHAQRHYDCHPDQALALILRC